MQQVLSQFLLNSSSNNVLWGPADENSPLEMAPGRWSGAVIVMELTEGGGGVRYRDRKLHGLYGEAHPIRLSACLMKPSTRPFEGVLLRDHGPFYNYYISKRKTENYIFFHCVITIYTYLLH